MVNSHTKETKSIDNRIMLLIGFVISLIIMGATIWIMGNSGANTIFPDTSNIGLGILISGMVLFHVITIYALIKSGKKKENEN